MREELGYRTEIVNVCRRMENKGLIAATDGNVSCRVGPDRMLLTPSGVPKGELNPVDLLLMDLEGKVIAGRGKPSSEIRLHLLVYRMRPDVQAVVHAHPPLLTAFTLAGMPFLAEALPEVWLTIGAVPTAPYATPTTEEVPGSVAPFVEKHQAVLLERHGSLTMGDSVKQAYLRLEKLEHAAHTLFYSQVLANRCPAPLSDGELARLRQLLC